MIDGREPSEAASGTLAGATVVPLRALARFAGAELSDKEEPILLVCETGARSELAAGVLRELGFCRVESLSGGVRAQRSQGELVAPRRVLQLTEAESERYARQVGLPALGVSGQERLARARVAIVGVGGLGCPVLLYLAAAGIGEIVIADDEGVCETNLHRQVLFGAADVGASKVACAARVARAQNPAVSVVERPVRVSASNVAEVCPGGAHLDLAGPRYAVLSLHLPHPPERGARPELRRGRRARAAPRAARHAPGDRDRQADRGPRHASARQDAARGRRGDELSRARRRAPAGLRGLRRPSAIQGRP